MTSSSLHREEFDRLQPVSTSLDAAYKGALISRYERDRKAIWDKYEADRKAIYVEGQARIDAANEWLALANIRCLVKDKRKNESPISPFVWFCTFHDDHPRRQPMTRNHDCSQSTMAVSGENIQMYKPQIISCAKSMLLQGLVECTCLDNHPLLFIIWDYTRIPNLTEYRGEFTEPPEDVRNRVYEACFRLLCRKNTGL